MPLPSRLSSSALLCSLVVLVMPVQLLFGQPRPTVSGPVKDVSGAAVERADVALLDAQRVAVVAARTGTDGRFTLGDVPPGRYVGLFR